METKLRGTLFINQSGNHYKFYTMMSDGLTITAYYGRIDKGTIREIKYPDYEWNDVSQKRLEHGYTPTKVFLTTVEQYESTLKKIQLLNGKTDEFQTYIRELRMYGTLSSESMKRANKIWKKVR